jgi:hypothetical protein
VCCHHAHIIADGLDFRENAFFGNRNRPQSNSANQSEGFAGFDEIKINHPALE